MLKRITVVLLIGLLAWAYQATNPPPPSICGSPGGPPVTALRMKLRDGRHLAYKEHGVSKEVAKYKIIFIHGFGSTRHDAVIATYLPPVLKPFKIELLNLLIMSTWNIVVNMSLLIDLMVEIIFRNFSKNWDSTLCLLTDQVMEKVIQIQKDQ